jgi:hypothetical protein
MDYPYSVVLICPADLREQGNLLACAFGHDVLPGQTFSVAVSAGGGEPATHYGCRAIAQQSFIDLFTGAAQGQLPPIPWGDFGLTEADVLALLPALIFDARPAAQSEGQFDDVCTANGLARLGVQIVQTGGDI